MTTHSLFLRATAALFTAVAPVSAIGTVIRYPAPEQHNLNTVCWTGSQYVAAGDLGAVYTSPDGLTWTRRMVPGSPNFAASATGAGRIVLGAEVGTVVTSTDGITWSTAILPGPDSGYENVRHLAWNGSAFRAVSDGASNWSSSDGLGWSRLTTSFFSSKLAVEGSSFVAWPSWAKSGLPQQLFRDPGPGWSDATTDLMQAMRHLVWNGVRYISVGPAGAAATSTDGTSWTLRTTGVTATLEQVIWTGSLAVAIGTDGTILTSPNGAAWTTPASGTTADLTCIAAGSGSMVAVGKGGVILRSPDGISWSVIRHSNDPVRVTGIDWTGTGVVAIAEPHATLTSPDGISWGRTPAAAGPTGTLLRVAQGAGKLVATDGASGQWTAPLDASSWTLGAPATSLSTACVWDGQQFATLCHAMDSGLNRWNSYITRSPDGVYWTPLSGIRWVPGDPTTPRDDLLFTGSRFLCSGRQSPDAITWSDSNVPGFSDFLFAAGSQYISVNVRGGIYTSPDGDSWTQSIPDSGIPVRGVIWTGYRLLAAGLDNASSQGIWDGGPGRPWIKIHPRGGVGIAWTGSRALVSSGSEPGPPHIFSLDDPDASLSPIWRYWQHTYFTPGQVANPAISGALADPDGDGQANVVEFMAASSPVSPQDRPSMVVIPPEGGQGSRFQWLQDTGRTGVTVRAEVSGDLGLWDTAASTPIDGSPGGLRTMQASAPAGFGRVWFRLRVTLHE